MVYESTHQTGFRFSKFLNNFVILFLGVSSDSILLINLSTLMIPGILKESYIDFTFAVPKEWLIAWLDSFCAVR